MAHKTKATVRGRQWYSTKLERVQNTNLLTSRQCANGIHQQTT